MTMPRPARVVEVEYMGDHRLLLSFSDGLVRELDFSGALTGGGVFEPLHDPVFFAKVVVDEVAGTVAWPNGVDLAPDVLHGDHEPASGASPQVLREYRLRPTG